MDNQVTERQRGPKRRWRAAALAGALALALGTVAGTAAPIAAAGPAGASCTTAQLLAADASAVDVVEADAQQGFLVKLNELRRSRGLGSLAWNGALATHASSWSEHMSAQGRLYHARDKGAGDGVEPHQDYVALGAQVVSGWQRLAENVGVGGVRRSCTIPDLQVNAGTAVEELHQAFVASPGHLANMVGDHNQVGIGVHVDASRMWVTVRFAKGDLPAGRAGSAQVIVTKATGSYVDAVYRLFAGRPASAGERAHWAPSVSAGDRLALTRALAVTDSWAGSRVDDLYRTVFGRGADAAGRAYWLGQIERGLPLESVGVELYRSQEYFAASGGTSVAWLQALYDDLLGRGADRQGLTYWTAQLDRGQPRSAVSANFYRSKESRRDRAARLHQQVIGTALADPGLQAWADRLAVVGDVGLAAELAATSTFWDRATR